MGDFEVPRGSMRPRVPPRGAKRTPRVPKTPPKGRQDRPRGPKRSPKERQETTEKDSKMNPRKLQHEVESKNYEKFKMTTLSNEMFGFHGARVQNGKGIQQKLA